MSRVGLVLLAGLLFLRLPFTVIAVLLRYPLRESICFTGAYWLTLLLIWVERDRLREYHIGPAAIVLLALGPIVGQIMYQIAKPTIDSPFLRPVRWLEIVPALCLLTALLLKGFPKPLEGQRAWAWAAAAVPIGLAAAAVSGLAYRHWIAQGGHEAIPFTTVAFYFTMQFTGAATCEEPTFRGFLWGALRQRHMSDLQACLLQSGLFWLGHVYYVGQVPVVFVLGVLVRGLLYGFLAWRSRSILPSMFAHGIVNGTTNFFASGSWL